ncbi:hypothetical protein A4A49_18267 [Nicotiana attenuata]|uniref:Carboxypeptidase A inhibitor-like domain-containing protein n=1 Tax=Nicotiana attenuata TaxID=49451 RepID=A0A1J6IXS2_NICAT|nr:hypothetical protein A4A49_18267 [Nicotiana attenuata]
MARNYAFYFIVALMVMSVYLAETPKVKILAVRDSSNVAAQLNSKLTGFSVCGAACHFSSECGRACPHCYYNFRYPGYWCTA